MLIGIAAQSENGIIGNSGKMPWSVPSEMRFFKTMTTHTIVVMGRKTFNSIGGGLPKRQNFVMSHSKGVNEDNVTFTDSIEDILSLSRVRDVFVIGGWQIYKLFLPYMDRFVLSTVKMEVEGDIYMPDLDEHFSEKTFLFEKEKFLVHEYS